MIAKMFFGKTSFGYKFSIDAGKYGVDLYVFTLLGLSPSMIWIFGYILNICLVYK